MLCIGSMFFSLFCLCPALAVLLEPAQRVRLMHDVLRRFFDVVAVAATLEESSFKGPLSRT